MDINEELAAGNNPVIGGPNVDGFSIGPLHHKVRVDIRGWHTGYKTGESNSAQTRLFRDGTQVAENGDANFDNYSLPVSAVIELQELATTSVTIRCTNSHATRSTFGVEARLSVIP